MNRLRTMEAAITSGLQFLEQTQLPNGSFDSFSSPTKRPFKIAKKYATTFAPAVILASLSETGERAMVIRKPLASWLLAQKSEEWSFNYWAKDGPAYGTMPYPDDLDDTFCALVGLARHDPSLFDGGVLGRVVRLLLYTESRVGGPYRTWLVPKSAPPIWQDIDVAVNANIACFLQQVAEPLPNLTAFLEDAISSGSLKSPYYPSWHPLAYYLARAYKGGYVPKLVAYITKHRRGTAWGASPLQTALAVSALLQLGYAPKELAPAIDFLVDRQMKDGFWPAEAFCLDPAIKGQKYYSGSPALTTALVIEALSRFARLTAPAAIQRRGLVDTTAEFVYTQAVKLAHKEMNALPKPLSRQGLELITKTQKTTNNREIILLPYMFADSLKRKGVNLPPELLSQLGLANLYGWIAYTIYDDFLDDEGKPLELSIANTALRYSLLSFERALASDTSFMALVRRTFDVIDSANTWEVMHCRFVVSEGVIEIARLPAYGNLQRLSERSLGHTLTPLGVLAAAGIDLSKPTARQIQQALHHYLIARQLNDDLHDWQKDLRAGHISFVVGTLLRELQVRPSKQPIEQLIQTLQSHFWHHSIDGFCETVNEHIALSRQSLGASGLLVEPNRFSGLLDNLQAVMERTIKEKAEAKRFLKAYQGRLSQPSKQGQA